MLKMYLLGQPRIIAANQDVTNLISNKGIGIIAYLISKRRGAKIHRESLAALFWGDSSDKSAKYNLRYTLWAIKKTLKDYNIEDDIILSQDKSYCLINKEADLECDLEDFELLAGEILKGNYENAEKFTKIYKGEFLQGFQIKDNRELDDWLIYQRERLQRIYFDSLKKLSEIFLNKKEYTRGIECLEKLLYINSLDEDIHRRLMKTYYLSGNRAAAMNQYKKCSDTLRNELNISPMKESIDLYKSIKAGQVDIPEEIVTTNVHKYPEYFVLVEIIEQIIYKYPNILSNIHKGYRLELAKLFPEINIEEVKSIKYLSVDIEKLRIFRACAEVLNKCMQEEELPKIRINDEIDKTSKEFLQYIEIKFPRIFMEMVLG